MHPDLETFRKLAKRGNLIPVYKELLLDADTPVSAFLKIGETPSFLLESVVGGEKWARYSFLGLRPSVVIRGRGRRLEVAENGAKRTLEINDPLEYLENMMAGYKAVEVEGLPRFSGGLVGYFGYDLVRFIEELPDKGRPGMDVPDMFLMLTDTMLIFDSLKQTIKVVSNAHIDGKSPDEAYEDANRKIDSVIKLLMGNGRKPRKAIAPEVISRQTGQSGEGFGSLFGEQEKFEEAVLKAKEYIKAGDIFQVVLSQRFKRDTDVEPFSVYRALRVINPSPYMYYLDTGDVKLVGSSPEILVRLEGGSITLRPIAGTRKRGETEERDKALEEELKRDPKENAEHIMLVDLGRNDVGRVAETGSVRVSELMSVEKYSHVMHMVSNVEGTLSEGLNAFDLFRACFPAGTVTGAPKIRAMEIIEELEPLRRGPYAGAVGYFGYSGNMDTCITIRTLIINGGTVYVQAGAGIVADSAPEREHTETVNKAMGMMKAVDMAEGMFKEK